MSITIPQNLSGTGGIIVYDSNQPGGILGPTVVNSYTTLSIPSYWRAINFIVQNLAAFPRSITQNNVEVPHRLDPILKRRPNAYQNSSKFWSTLFFHVAHEGNGFAVINRDTQNNPISFDNAPPASVFPFRWRDDDGNLSMWYYVGGSCTIIQPRVVASADMIHLNGLSFDGMVGMQPVWTLTEAFERSRVVDKFITKFLIQGTVLKGAVEVPAGLSKDQQETLVATLRQHFRGSEAERDVIVLTDGAKLSNTTINNTDSQLIELSSYTTKQIAQITGVPPVFLFENSEAKYNSSVEEAFDMAARDLFRPKLHEYEAELSLKLLTPSEQDAGFQVKFDLKALLKGNATVQSTIVTAQKTAGVITTNEARAILGYAKSTDPDADKLSTLGNSTPSAEPAKPTATPPVKHSKPSAAEQFTPLFSDAAARVETKTSKASDTATKKHKGDDLTRWANVFSGEQAKYVADALSPIFTTIATITDAQPHDAIKIGETYASALRGHFAKVVRGEESILPTLSQFISETISKAA